MRKVIRRKKAAEILGIHLNTLDRIARTDPKFPRKVQIGPRASGFFDDELDAYAESRQTPIEAVQDVGGAVR